MGNDGVARSKIIMQKFNDSGQSDADELEQCFQSATVGDVMLNVS